VQTDEPNLQNGIMPKSDRVLEPEKPMSNNTPSRRTLLADAPAIAAAAALAAGTATSGPATALAGHPATDPVFAAIETHKTAIAAYVAAFDDTEDEDAINKTSDAEADALEAALTCRPTTHEGAIALLEHLSTPFEDSTVLAFAFGAGEGSSLHQAAGNLPALVAETLRSNRL
jgi:predicted hotdog family 3-hydroxylacyl-ACP dehydratase